MILSRSLEISAGVLFFVAIVHTFMTKQFQKRAHHYPEGSLGENLFHLLGEVEIVFGLWAGVFIVLLATVMSSQHAIEYLESLNFTEPVFVFVIMTVCASRPILDFAGRLISGLARLLPGNRNMAEYVTLMVVGPLLGSLITEPAAMTVTALMLLRQFFSRSNNNKFKYASLGLLFVNVSVGGTLTSYAAPPVLMVASKWNWDSAFMFSHFGWKAVIACVVSAVATMFVFRGELKGFSQREAPSAAIRTPLAVDLIHLVFVLLIVLTAHHIIAFVGLFLFFLGVANVTREYQDELQLKQGLLVGFFLAGLVVLGGPQGWWLKPVLLSLENSALFVGAATLTAVTDNAALTYLGSLVPEMSDFSRYALVAGAVVGGGLTVIANAPNPAGYGILATSFGEDGISPLGLFAAALPPTLVAAVCFWFF